MSMVINNNISALKAHRNLGTSNRNMTGAIEKLSSGYKINVGADDPSGLVISEQLRSQISGLNRAIRNSSEAYNLISIAEGALNEMNNILKKMRSLAIHAANEVTSPEQIEADQAELDSGIQTINRIANTNKYSDQFLLNGSKELVYDVNTQVNDTGDHAMIDIGNTRVDQVFKRTGVVMTIGYTGYKNDYQANTANSAQRAYYEADNAYAKCQLDGNKITAKQKFILTGTSGSKQFSFPEGTDLGTIVAQINNSKDSTGVGATLTFASNVRIDKSTDGGDAPDYASSTRSTGQTDYDNTAGAAYRYEAGDIQVYGADMNNPVDSRVSGVTVTPAAANSFVVGKNCDGDGKVYAKVINAANGSIEWYKDKECTMLIGKGDAGFFAPANNSGIPGSPDMYLDGLYMTLTDKAENLDVYEVALVGQRMDNQADMHANDVASWADMDTSVISGVNLGVNTGVNGDLHFRYTPITTAPDGTVTEFKVEVFRDSNMEPSSLVASSGVVSSRPTELPQTVRVESVMMELDTNPGFTFDSGLNLTLNVPPPDFTPAGELPKGEQGGSVTFTNVGMRLYSTDYGSNEYVRIQNQEGELFYYYREADTMEKVMVQGEKTVMRYGQDANLGMNGTSILTNGLTANVTTADFSGKLVFNGGTLGCTTIAVAGHERGSLFSKAEALQGVEERNASIRENERYFEPRSLNLKITGMQNEAGTDLSLYLDFSDLDPSVRAKINNFGNPSTIEAKYYVGPPAQITIDAADLGTGSAINIATFNVDPDKLKEGFRSTEANLQGLFIKTSDTIDTTKGTDGTATGQMTAFEGDKLVETMTYATHPRTNTTETLSNFQGGMQFQLGNTSGDQDRTIYSIQSMDIANLGKIEWNDVKYCLQDVQSSGVSSLMRDPIMAMRIIEQAVNDVSTLRSRLGAFQANMLQTNINSLEISVENLTETESAIRNTDMASESTEFTKNQIMVQASTSMLAQANSITQNVLSLLQ